MAEKRWTICPACERMAPDSRSLTAKGCEGKHIEVLPADSPNVLSREEIAELAAAYLHGTPSDLRRIEPLMARLVDYAGEDD